MNFLLALFCLSAFAQEGKVRLSRVTDRIYVAESTFYHPENSAVYIGDQSVTVISATWTPATAKLLADEVRKITDKPVKAVINTHYHLDRTGGNAYFKKIGARIIATRKTAELTKKNWESGIKSTRKDFPSFPEMPYVPADLIFENRHDLEDGKIQIRYFGPSHTEDGVVVYFPDEQILFGDCILKEKLGWLGDANVKEYPKTLARIKELKIKKIIAGHWTAIHGPELIDRMLAQLRELPR